MRIKSALHSIVFLVVVSPVAADEPLVLNLWPEVAPDEVTGIGPETIRMSPRLERKMTEVTESTRMITNVTQPSVTVYRPPQEQDTGTAMLIFPGGGYWNLYWDVEGVEVADWLTSRGMTGIILKYRVPRRPGEKEGVPASRPLQDAQRALSLVRSQAKQWGLRSDRIGVVGFSAGGHLAISAATSFERRAYEPKDEIDKVSCRPDFAVAVYSGYLKNAEKDELASELRIPKHTPAVFLVHGNDDIISPPQHSALMYLALKRSGIPAELHIYASSTHGFGVRSSDRPYATWPAACTSWLQHQGLLEPR